MMGTTMVILMMAATFNGDEDDDYGEEDGATNNNNNNNKPDNNWDSGQLLCHAQLMQSPLKFISPCFVQSKRRLARNPLCGGKDLSAGRPKHL